MFGCHFFLLGNCCVENGSRGEFNSLNSEGGGWVGTSCVQKEKVAFLAPVTCKSK